jgi:hypothetical protein
MNRKVIIAVVVIGGSGIMNSALAKPPKPLTPVILGSYIFLFVLAIMDMYGGPMSQLSGALAMLAVTYVLLTEVPWQTIIGALQGSGASAPIATSCPTGWIKVPTTQNSSGFICTQVGATTCPPGFQQTGGGPGFCSPIGSK